MTKYWGATSISGAEPIPAGSGLVLTSTGSTQGAYGWAAPSGSMSPTLISGASTMQAGNYFLCDTSGGSYAVTLPSSPVNGTTVGLMKTTSDSNYVNITTNVDGYPLRLNSQWEAQTLIYSAASAAWFRISRFGGITYRGVWSATTVYQPGDVVIWAPSGSNNMYIQISNTGSAAGTAPSTTSTWDLVSSALPAGGNAGQVLVKNSSTNYDFGFATLSGEPNSQRFTSGNNTLMALNGSVMTNQAVTASTCYFVPFFAPRAMLIYQMGIYVQTSALTSTAYLGVYAMSSSTGDPTGSPLGSGTVATTSTGFKQVTLSLTLSTPGWYYMAVANNGAPTLNTLAASACPPLPRGYPAAPTGALNPPISLTMASSTTSAVSTLTANTAIAPAVWLYVTG